MNCVPDADQVKSGQGIGPDQETCTYLSYGWCPLNDLNLKPSPAKGDCASEAPYARSHNDRTRIQRDP